MTKEDKLKIAINEYIGYPPEVDEDITVSFKRAAFADGANWQYHQFIEKACEWLSIYYPNIDRIGIDSFITEFQQAMKGGAE